MLRITSSSCVSNETLKLEGKLVEPWVAELLQTASDLLEQGLQIRLDLAAVSFVDTAGSSTARFNRPWCHHRALFWLCGRSPEAEFAILIQV